MKQDVTLIDKEDSALLAEYLDTETKGDSGFGGSCPDLTDLEIGEYLKDESKGDTILLKVRDQFYIVIVDHKFYKIICFVI